jgi:hypothetical protein
MTIEEATLAVNKLPFPEVKIGDNVFFNGFWFLYDGSKWNLDESKNK